MYRRKSKINFESGFILRVEKYKLLSDTAQVTRGQEDGDDATNGGPGE
jgi:hypothetical protein